MNKNQNIKEAYHRGSDQYITIENYRDNIHYKDIVCPECKTAAIHIVRKQTTTYFASNRKEEHEENCQHYRDFIQDNQIKNLIQSQLPEDQDRLEFLIWSNLNATLNLLRKDNSTPIHNNIGNSSPQNSSSVSKGRNIKKESIQRVHIKNLLNKKTNLIGQYVIIYGISDIEKKHIKDKYTDRNIFLNLYFRSDNKFIFSISLTTTDLIKHFDKKLADNAINQGFAVFGLLNENKNFLSIKIEKEIDDLRFL